MIGTIDALRTYAVERENEPTGLYDDTLATAALVRASDYITYHYVDRFQSGFDEDSPRVAPAAYEAALLELETPGFWTKTYTSDERKVLVGVGDIRWQVIGGASSNSAAPVSTKIEAMLRPYLSHWPAVMVV